MRLVEVRFSVVVPFSSSIGLGSDVRLVAELASAPDELARGLSGRVPRPGGYAMVFDFGGPAHPSMTMRGVGFPIDMVFADAAGFVKKAVTVPAFGAGPYRSSGETRWVVELPAGWAHAHAIREGSVVGVYAMAG